MTATNIFYNFVGFRYSPLLSLVSSARHDSVSVFVFLIFYGFNEAVFIANSMR